MDGSYMNGVREVLEWLDRSGLGPGPLQYTPEELEAKFLQSRTRKTSDERFQAYCEAADAHLLGLRSALEHCESADPENFARDPAWFDAYIHYCWAKNLKGDVI